jgi:excisionase family DNA binding protein
MATLTLGQAARLAGRGKTTIARAIKAGHLTATRTPFGHYEIDRAELAKIYPLRSPEEDADATVVWTGTSVHHETQETALRASLAESRLADAQALIAELRADRDAWREQAQRLASGQPAKRRRPGAK